MEHAGPTAFSATSQLNYALVNHASLSNLILIETPKAPSETVPLHLIWCSLLVLRK